MFYITLLYIYNILFIFEHTSATAAYTHTHMFQFSELFLGYSHRVSVPKKKEDAIDSVVENIVSPAPLKPKYYDTPLSSFLYLKYMYGICLM